MSTFLDASRHSFLPKFMSSSGSSQSINMKKPPSMTSEVRSGARERYFFHFFDQKFIEKYANFFRLSSPAPPKLAPKSVSKFRGKVFK